MTEQKKTKETIKTKGDVISQEELSNLTLITEVDIARAVTSASPNLKPYLLAESET